MRRTLLLAAALIASPALAQEPRPAEANAETIVSRLVEAVGTSHAPVHLSYRASSCQAADEIRLNGVLDPVPVPMRPPRRETSVASSIRAMFAGVDRVQVIEDAAGAVRVTIDDPHTALLQAPVSLHLSTDERYNANLAIIALENSRDFRAAVVQAGMQPAFVVGSWLFTTNRSGPVLPPHFRNATADEVLDRIARTFGQVIVFSICPDGRTYLLNTSGQVRYPVDVDSESESQ